jgi:hypothetical protein
VIERLKLSILQIWKIKIEHFKVGGPNSHKMTKLRDKNTIKPYKNDMTLCFIANYFIMLWC